jgi:hypothetical protein
VRGRPTRTAESFTLPWKSVFVEEIDDKGVAHCVDQFGKPISLPVAVRRGKGALPAVGERWIIDRSLSNRWTFAAVQSARPPTITGERDANGALGALLTALVDAGLVVDATTEGTGGGGPGGPGVTDHGALTGLGDDDHPQYHTDARGDVRYYTKAGGDTHYDARYDTLGAADNSVAAHVAQTDPHVQYLRQSEADALYDDLGAADAAVAAHVTADPAHTAGVISVNSTSFVHITATRVQEALAQIDLILDDLMTGGTTSLYDGGDWSSSYTGDIDGGGWGSSYTSTIDGGSW